MSACKCVFRVNGVVLDEKCENVKAHWFCEIDNYDKDIGCNRTCHGYSEKKDVKK